MSNKDFNPNDPDSWSDEDILYAASRGIEIPAEQLEAFGGVEALREAMEGEAKVVKDGPKPKPQAKDTVNEDAGDGDYESMSNDDLRTLLAERAMAKGEEPDVSGKKADLIARLEAQDAESVPA